MMENAEVVKTGICIYSGNVTYQVRIVKWHILYGTGDYEDPPEIADDREIECYYVWYENLINKGVYNRGGGSFLSVAEAIFAVEQTGSVEWRSA